MPHKMFKQSWTVECRISHLSELIYKNQEKHFLLLLLYLCVCVCVGVCWMACWSHIPGDALLTWTWSHSAYSSKVQCCNSHYFLISLLFVFYLCDSSFRHLFQQGVRGRPAAVWRASSLSPRLRPFTLSRSPRSPAMTPLSTPSLSHSMARLRPHRPCCPVEPSPLWEPTD